MGMSMRMSYFRVTTLFIALLPIQMRTFSVYWNVPSEICFKKKINLSLEKYEIKAHPNYTFYGENVVIFYEFTFGLYPYFKNYNESYPVNGGLPQKANLTAHLEAVKENITKLIPDKNFTGFGVLDLEEWRPLFEQHSRNSKEVYQNASIKLVKEKNSSLTEEEARAKAEVEFNDAAKEFIVKTIQKAKELRPQARWGLYGYPFCNYDAGKEDGIYNCSQKYRGFNDKIHYIYNETTALFPSIYLGFNASSEQRFRYVQAVVTEAFRVANNFTPPLPVYPYSKFEYNPLKELASFYNKSDLCSTVMQPAAVGVSGLILWSSSRNMTDRCNYIKNYTAEYLGPEVQKAIQKQQQCRNETSCPTNKTCALNSSKWEYPIICSSTDSSTNDETPCNDYECTEKYQQRNG